MERIQFWQLPVHRYVRVCTCMHACMSVCLSVPVYIAVLSERYLALIRPLDPAVTE